MDLSFRYLMGAAIILVTATPAQPEEFSQTYYDWCMTDTWLIASLRSEIIGWRALIRSGIPLERQNPAAERAVAAIRAVGEKAGKEAHDHAHWRCVIEAKQSYDIRMYLWDIRNQEYKELQNTLSKVLKDP